MTNSVKDALYVPIEAVQIDGEEKYVNIQQSGTTEGAASTKKVVETGISNDRYIEITSGLEEDSLFPCLSPSMKAPLAAAAKE